MPSCKLTKRTIDALPSPAGADQIWWDEDLKGFGLKFTPASRKVFLVQYRPAGNRQNPRKYTIGEYGSVTPHQARVEAQRVLAERAAGRDPQEEKQTSKRRIRSDQVADLTGQRRDEVGRMAWEHLDLRHKLWVIPGEHAKNGKPHIVQLSVPVLALIGALPRAGELVFSGDGGTVFQGYSKAKARLDDLSGVSDWTLHDLRRTVVARLGVAPHVTDKILNHQSGTISGVAAVYQRHEFLKGRKQALELWGEHVQALSRLSARA